MKIKFQAIHIIMKIVTATIHWILAMCYIPCGASHMKAWDHPL